MRSNLTSDVPHEIRDALRETAGRRGPFGESLFYFHETGSTNDEAARLADAGAPEGTTVVAAVQTAGRGRLGRTWYSPAGAGLYASVVIRDRRAAPLLTLAGGVAIAEGIQAATALPVEIKWPNDIVIDAGLGRRRKLAGILTEASSGAEGLQSVVLGFGINVLPAAYPPDVADRATSLAAELTRPVDAGPVLAECLASLRHRVGQLVDGREAELLTRWSELSPSAHGARVECESPRGILGGTTTGIGPDGALLVRTADRVEAVRSGQIRWL